MTALLEACVPVQAPDYFPRALVPGSPSRPYLNTLLPSTWVQLLDLPSTYSHDEALLLCQLSDDEWVAWIPNHGEAVLHIGQLCSIG